MQRRTFVKRGTQFALAGALGGPLLAAVKQDRLDAAADLLAQTVKSGQVAGAVLHVAQRQTTFTRAFGTAKNENAMFLLGSISKPISVAALMILYNQNEFKLDDPLQKFLPEFKGGGRDKVTIQHLLTHTSGLPDQLPENDALRKKHASLFDFVQATLQTPLSFAPGTRYQYSSMGIMLTGCVAEEIFGPGGFGALVDHYLFDNLGMDHSALGLGEFKLSDMLPVQIEFAAVEAGGGDPSAKEWDWNSPYWRTLGAPWGGIHASAPDLGKFLAEFLDAKGKVLGRETARMMIRNHNPPGFTPRGLGFAVGAPIASPGCSEKTFGHGGSTGTLAWADPVSETICVVLTTLPGRAIKPHPREQAAALVAAGME